MPLPEPNLARHGPNCGGIASSLCRVDATPSPKRARTKLGYGIPQNRVSLLAVCTYGIDLHFGMRFAIGIGEVLDQRTRSAGAIDRGHGTQGLKYDPIWREHRASACRLQRDPTCRFVESLDRWARIMPRLGLAPNPFRCYISALGETPNQYLSAAPSVWGRADGAMY